MKDYSHTSSKNTAVEDNKSGRSQRFHIHIQCEKEPGENGNTYVAKTTLYKEIPTRELEPYEVSLDSMIKTLDYHQKTFRVDYHIYKPLKEAKQLRNRIHLDTAADDIRDNDYNVFSRRRTKRDEKDTL